MLKTDPSPEERTVPADVSRQTYPFSLPPLPYAFDALEPHLDRKTLELHHDKHHATYVAKLNEALALHSDLHPLTLAQLLAAGDKLPEDIRAAVKNNGGGHLNHDLFWNSLTPGPARAVRGPLADAVNGAFGSFENFRKQFADAAAKHFASGWVALARDGAGKPVIVDLHDHQVVPAQHTALLILDVWEHAYYLKFQNRRPEFIEAFWNVVNWERAEEAFGRAGR